MLVDKVYLVGFMCSGKSTVAASLANRLGWQVHDIDTLVEKREGMSIPEIFSQRGELYFRSVERDILSEVVAFRDAVVATGGGTYVDDANRQSIDKDGVSIWLDVSLKQVTARLPDNGHRPLAGDLSKMEQLFYSRQTAYRRAKLHLEAESGSADELSEQIFDWLQKRG
tara:strand:- start:1942 stop:2448 length:507 start_codon:yes stop_codon:yes gene_type:complete